MNDVERLLEEWEADDWPELVPRGFTVREAFIAQLRESIETDRAALRSDSPVSRAELDDLRATIRDGINGGDAMTAGQRDDAMTALNRLAKIARPTSETTCRIHGTPLEERESQGGGVPGLVCVLCAEELHGASTGGERDDYRAGKPLEGGWTVERGVTCVVCPDCAFAFDAIHEDEPNGGYSCPCCHPALPEGGIEVEIEHDGVGAFVFAVDRANEPIVPGPYVLLPRQVGDPNGGDDG